MSAPNRAVSVYLSSDVEFPLHDVVLAHRYEDDEFRERYFWRLTRDEPLSADPVLAARCWEGTLRTGSDYLLLKFSHAGDTFELRDGSYAASAGKGKAKVSGRAIAITLGDYPLGSAARFRIRDVDGRFVVEFSITGPGYDKLLVATIDVERTGGHEFKPLDHVEKTLQARERYRLTHKRPFYLIAHKCNDKDALLTALKGGANGIECDVMYETNTKHSPDKAWYVRHPNWVVSDNYFNGEGTPLTTWLGWLETELKSGAANALALIVFDVKTGATLDQFYAAVRARVPAEVTVLFSYDKLSDASWLKELKAKVGGNVAVAIDGDNDVDAVERYFVDNNIRGGWYGNGMNSGMRDGSNIRHSLEKAAHARNTTASFKKVYAWTYTDPDVILMFIDSIDFGDDLAVDGILVEVAALAKRDWPGIIARKKRIRLATRSDNPFEAFGV